MDQAAKKDVEIEDFEYEIRTKKRVLFLNEIRPIVTIINETSL